MNIGAPILVLIAFCGQGLAQSSEARSNVTDPHFKIAPGYLKPAELPNSLVLLGSPPEPDSAALAKDEEARKATIPDPSALCHDAEGVVGLWSFHLRCKE